MLLSVESDCHTITNNFLDGNLTDSSSAKCEGILGKCYIDCLRLYSNSFHKSSTDGMIDQAIRLQYHNSYSIIISYNTSLRDVADL